MPAANCWPSCMPASAAIARRKASGRWISRPQPSPLRPSPPTAPRWARRDRAVSAASTRPRLARSSRSAISPKPQLSRSKPGECSPRGEAVPIDPPCCQVTPARGLQQAELAKRFDPKVTQAIRVSALNPRVSPSFQPAAGCRVGPGSQKGDAHAHGTGRQLQGRRRQVDPRHQPRRVFRAGGQAHGHRRCGPAEILDPLGGKARRPGQRRAADRRHPPRLGKTAARRYPARRDRRRGRRHGRGSRAVPGARRCGAGADQSVDDRPRGDRALPQFAGGQCRG